MITGMASKAARKAYEERWPEKVRESHRKSAMAYRERHPERVALLAAKRKADGREALASRKHYYKKTYGMSLEEVDEAKGMGCAICQSHDSLAIDHCHKSGKVRGVLCGKCNRGLGNFLDDPQLLRAAALYLEGE